MVQWIYHHTQLQTRATVVTDICSNNNFIIMCFSSLDNKINKEEKMISKLQDVTYIITYNQNMVNMNIYSMFIQWPSYRL